MISQQDWHTNYKGEGYTTVRNKFNVICTFNPQYSSKEYAVAISAFPEVLRTLQEALPLVEEVDTDKAMKIKKLLRRLGEM